MRGIVAFAVCSISAIASAQQPSLVPVIAGQVLAVDSDTPLRRARITASAGRSASEPVLTGNDGRFFIQAPGSGTVPVTLTVVKGGYVTATTKVEGKDVQAPLLVRLTRGAAISGVVVDSSGGPVAAMSVTAAQVGGASAAATPTQHSATTDDRGEYRLAGLARGRYEIWAGIASTIVESPPGSKGEPVRREVGAGEKTVVTLETAEEVSGVQLVAPNEGAAQAALRVLFENARISANSGAIVITGATAPTSRIPATAPVPGQAAAIRGRVLSAARKPVPGASVRVMATGVERTLRTDDSGAFSFDGLAPGRYMLQANLSDQTTWYFGQNGPGQAGRPMSVARDQVIDGVDVVLPPTRAISGVVVDEHGEPLQGVRVQAMQPRYAAGRLVAAPVGSARSTDDRGRYRLWGLQPNSYLVAASIEGLVPAGRSQDAYAKTSLPRHTAHWRRAAHRCPRRRNRQPGVRTGAADRSPWSRA